jgi:hypothetical protein
VVEQKDARVQGVYLGSVSSFVLVVDVEPAQVRRRGFWKDGGRPAIGCAIGCGSGIGIGKLSGSKPGGRGGGIGGLASNTGSGGG